LQFFLVWYIDGARYIDLPDLKWKVFTTFEKVESEGIATYSLTGMLSMYEYYAWHMTGSKVKGKAAASSGGGKGGSEEIFNKPFVECIRPRISQVFVMPPHQRKGFGQRLLQAAYDYCLAKKANVVDVAIEEPSDDMVKLRDRVDCQNCLSQIPNPQGFFSQPFSETSLKTMRETLLLGKAQARRVFEILQWHFLEVTNPAAVRAYRLSIKTRLIQPVVREKKEEEKLTKGMVDEELDTHNKAQKAFRDQLSKQYDDLIDQYKGVLHSVRA
jgi:histone acetyltransferase 1